MSDETTTTIAEAQVNRAEEIKRAQSKARAQAKGGSQKAAAPKGNASKAPRQPIPEGQSRSRGRLILSATGPCNATGKVDGNPGRWPVGQHKVLAKANGLKADARSCTTHLRALARKAGITDNAALEAELIGIAQGKARKPRAAKTAQVAPAATTAG
jgi:hypothetical protein